MRRMEDGNVRTTLEWDDRRWPQEKNPSGISKKTHFLKMI